MYFNHTEVLNIFYLTFFPLFSFPCHPNSAWWLDEGMKLKHEVRKLWNNFLGCGLVSAT
jgi:hypothetical protein